MILDVRNLIHIREPEKPNGAIEAPSCKPLLSLPHSHTGYPIRWQYLLPARLQGIISLVPLDKEDVLGTGADDVSVVTSLNANTNRLLLQVLVRWEDSS